MFTLATKNNQHEVIFGLRDLSVMSLCHKCEPGLKETINFLYELKFYIFVNYITHAVQVTLGILPLIRSKESTNKLIKPTHSVRTHSIT